MSYIHKNPEEGVWVREMTQCMKYFLYKVKDLILDHC